MFFPGCFQMNLPELKTFFPSEVRFYGHWERGLFKLVNSQNFSQPKTFVLHHSPFFPLSGSRGIGWSWNDPVLNGNGNGIVLGTSWSSFQKPVLPAVPTELHLSARQNGILLGIAISMGSICAEVNDGSLEL